MSYIAVPKEMKIIFTLKIMKPSKQYFRIKYYQVFAPLFYKRYSCRVSEVIIV